MSKKWAFKKMYYKVYIENIILFFLFIFSVIKLSIKFEEIILNLNAALFWQTFGVFSLLDLDPHGGCGSGSERHPSMRIRILTSAINESFQGCQLKDKN